MRKILAVCYLAFIAFSIGAHAGFVGNPYSLAPPVSGISLVGTASNTGLNGSDIIVTLPPGTAIGDVVFAAYCVGGVNNAGQAALTAGYTELADLGGNDDDDVGIGVYRKVIASGPDTQIQFEGRGNANSSVAGVVMVLRGVDTTTPQDATTTTASGANSGAADPPAITTATDGAWVIAAGAGAHDAITAGPSGYDDFIGAAEGDTERCAVGLARFLKETAGSENPGAFTITTSATRSWAAATAAARPAP